jgi:hypothetical protein
MSFPLYLEAGGGIRYFLSLCEFFGQFGRLGFLLLRY